MNIRFLGGSTLWRVQKSGLFESHVIIVMLLRAQ